MKYFLTTTILIVTVLFSLQSCQQNSTNVTKSEVPPEFLGKWIYISSSYLKEDTLWLTRTNPSILYDWGQKIEIYSNGDFIDSYTAWCGNDDNIHHTKGNWTYDDKTKIFEATINICLKDTKYKISNVTQDTLIFTKP